MQQCANSSVQLSQELSSTFVLHKFILYCGFKEVELPIITASKIYS